MGSNDLIHLTAFLIALKKLDQPLPENIQTQLNLIGKSLQTDPNNSGNLDIIAESYPILDDYYQQALAEIENYQSVRTKGGEPEPFNNEPTKELTNAAINIFNNSNSVDAAQKNVKSSLLTKVMNFITGR
ncbi:MAG TPA: hypothetical protein VK184_24650 [Nostocaceae cyanobacterium]|nr:hypothetical protein [Nostocaceae cyanobacterium]